jgi:hypothetical protein
MTLIDALAARSALGVDELFSDEVSFRSPYTDYSGRGEVAHLVSLIRQVLVELTPVQQLREHGKTMTLFDARVADQDVQGMLYEEQDGNGRVRHAMLTIRPYAGLRASMRAMQALMEE